MCTFLCDTVANLALKQVNQRAAFARIEEKGEADAVRSFETGAAREVEKKLGAR